MQRIRHVIELRITRSFGRGIGKAALVGVVFASLASPAAAQRYRDVFEHGNDLYRDRLYETAVEFYSDAADRAGRPLAEAEFNKGCAHAAGGSFALAAPAFREADRLATDDAMRYRARFNLGHALYANGASMVAEHPYDAIAALTESARAFKAAYRIDPTQRQAAQNVEIVREAIQLIRDQLELAQELEDLAQEQQQASGEGSPPEAASGEQTPPEQMPEQPPADENASEPPSTDQATPPEANAEPPQDPGSTDLEAPQGPIGPTSNQPGDQPGDHQPGDQRGEQSGGQSGQSSGEQSQPGTREPSTEQPAPQQGERSETEAGGQPSDPSQANANQSDGDPQESRESDEPQSAPGGSPAGSEPPEPPTDPSAEPSTDPSAGPSPERPATNEQPGGGTQASPNEPEAPEQAERQMSLNERVAEAQRRLEEALERGLTVGEREAAERAAEALERARQEQERALDAIEQQDDEERTDAQQRAAELLRRAAEQLGEAQPRSRPQSQDPAEQGDPQEGEGGRQESPNPTDPLVEALLDREQREREMREAYQQRTIRGVTPVERDW